VRRLGSARRVRCLFEALLKDDHQDSGFVQLNELFLDQHAVALISVQGEGKSGGSHHIGKGSRIALLEANERAFEASHAKDFALIRKVAQSTPPRAGRKTDPLRSWGAVILVLSVVVLSATKLLPLASLCVMAAALLIGSDILTVDEAFGSISLAAWLVSGAAIGLGNAMQSTGVAAAIANGLVSAAKHVCTEDQIPFGIAASVFVATSFLSNLISNTATAALMMPIVEGIAMSEGIGIKFLVMIVIYAANCPFSTPFATSGNMMVMQPMGPDAPGYVFMDYMRFGLPLQVICLFIGVPACYFLVGTN